MTVDNYFGDLLVIAEDHKLHFFKSKYLVEDNSDDDYGDEEDDGDKKSKEDDEEK